MTSDEKHLQPKDYDALTTRSLSAKREYVRGLEQRRDPEAISLLVECKVPGLKIRMQPVKMDFDYGGSFGAPSPDAYERLLLDAVSGDMTLFTHEDEAYRTWRFLEGIMDGWAKLPPPAFPNYASGSWGPDEAEQMLARDGRVWRRP